MKKAMIMLMLMLGSAVLDADISVNLDQSFLAIPGRYVFTLDLKNKKRDKEWEVIVADGKAAIKSMGGLQSTGISIGNNVIKIETGPLKKATDLEILTKYSTTFAVGTVAHVEIEKTTKNFNVRVGQGLGVILAASEKAKVGSHCTYAITGGDLPDGNYTATLKIPAASKIKPPTSIRYKFNVQDGIIATLLPKSDSTGKIKIAGQTTYLEIDADDMCKRRRGKKAALGLGIGIPVALGSIAVLKWNSSWMQKLGNQLKALESLIGFNTELIPRALGSFIDFAAFQAFSRSGAQAISKTTEVVAQAITGKKPQQVEEYKPEATLQITYDLGNWQGNNAVRFDYAECNNNLFVLFKSDKKINITTQ